MNLDTIKFKMQLENLDYKPEDWVEKTDKYISDGHSITFLRLLNRPLGITRVDIFPQTNAVVCECSAKILQEDYLKGININTLERLYSVLKTIIAFSFSDLENAVVLKADITENLYFESVEAKQNAVQSLILGKCNSAFIVEDYCTNKKITGLTFTGRQRSFKSRQIYYDKAPEIMRPCNREIACFLDYNKYSPILRVEQSNTDFIRIRQAIEKPKLNLELISNQGKDNNVRLKEIVSSNAKPLYVRHQKIMQYANEITLFDEFDNWDDAIFFYGIKGLYIACNCDIGLLLNFCKSTCTRSKYYNLKNKIQSYISSITIGLVQNSGLSTEKNGYTESLKIISEMLKAA